MRTGWNEGLSVGVPDIDAQHRELFERVARLEDALGRGDRGELRHLLEFLRDYALLHFDTEEREMAAGFPRCEQHRAAHRGFLERYLLLWKAFEHEGTTALLTLRVRNWIDLWLRDHVRGEDQALGAWLAGRRAG